eukprot:g8749.t1
MPRYEQRANILQGAGAMIFNMVCERSTPEQWSEWLRVPLEHAASTANADLVDKLLKAGADGSAGWKGCNGQTLLHAGAEGGNERVMSALIRAGAKEDMNVQAGAAERAPLHLAANDRLRLVVEIPETAEARGPPQGRPSRRARRGQVKVEVTMGGVPNGGGGGAAGSSAGDSGGRRAAQEGDGGSGGRGLDGVAAWLIALREEDVFRKIVGFL